MSSLGTGLNSWWQVSHCALSRYALPLEEAELMLSRQMAPKAWSWELFRVSLRESPASCSKASHGDKDGLLRVA